MTLYGTSLIEGIIVMQNVLLTWSRQGTEAKYVSTIATTDRKLDSLSILVYHRHSDLARLEKSVMFW